MKRILALLFIASIGIYSYSQDKFVIPQVSELQKYQNAALQLNASYLIQISYAKSLGKTVEDAGSYVGDQLKYTWDRTGGFDAFVRGTLYTMLTLVPYGTVEVTGQTNNSIEYLVTGFYSDLREGGSVFDVTYEEYLKFWETVFAKIGDYMSAIYTQTDTDEGLLVKIRKR